MSDERRPIKAWGSRLSGEGEPLTLEEARTYAALSAADRALETRDLLRDIQIRLQRLERFAEAAIPGYREVAAGRFKALDDVRREDDRSGP